MNAFKGYRTIIAMVLGIIFSVLSANGWMVPESEQAAIQAGIISLVGLVLRLVTTGPIGKGEN
jgi:hypothetical protein